ncbi:hydrogenase maturation protease [Mycobacterium xenopi]|uniref:Peptidase M52 n=1 Tax=Mycobacterium xenopi TaxID=1789 RepID=A0AAD1H3U6_MYCXE|nr:hydrogenase maturation protease [Mycobacterium xenopi]MDA3641357.1 hydrogenase maturation protease [Mycobacterium xenopi]MDA3659298.1 hydrogenase maturation protease [Mycobacterium xenopi]MDA3663621.1 hydrogenase maturation protease [Mycobacterium xenopi]ORX19378.1 peptidase M52 [Mycobacterium xenopi]SPX89319.1 hydrogenase maturation protease [Mycobacterium xenopi]
MSARSARILVAGIGNIFLGDDGFGPEVLRQLPGRLASESVRVSDYGIGGMHLAYDLLEEWDALVLVDALPNRGCPGTVHVFEADHGWLASTPALDAHAMDPAAVFASVRALGGVVPRTIVVGCEVADVADGMGLSEPVRAAVPEAVAAVESAVAMLADAAAREV